MTDRRGGIVSGVLKVETECECLKTVELFEAILSKRSYLLVADKVGAGRIIEIQFEHAQRGREVCNRFAKSREAGRSGCLIALQRAKPKRFAIVKDE